MKEKSKEVLAYLKDVFIQYEKAENKLKASNQQLQATEQQLQAANQQLTANNQQLTSSEQQLRAANQQLNANNQQLMASEKELQETTEYLENLISYANAPIIVWDTGNKITLFNKAFERLTGRNIDDVIGKKIDILFPKDKLEESLKYIKETSKGIKWEVLEISIQHIDGAIKTVLWNSANIYSSDNKMIIATIAQGQDITKRKQAEEELKAANQQLLANNQQLQATEQQLQAANQQLTANNQQLTSSEQQLRAANQQLDANNQQLIASEKSLRESEEKFHSLFSEMSEGVYLHEIIYDKKGKAIDYRIIEANSASEKNLNINPEKAVGKLATELFGTKEAPFLEIYTKVTKTGKPVQFEQYFPPLKRHFHISVYSPGKNKFATVFSDITERKQAEEELIKHREHLEELVKERTAELEEKNKELVQFNDLFVNREFRIKELKDKVKELEKRLNE